MAEALSPATRELTIEEKALLWDRFQLEARRKEEENNLPRQGKAPATADDLSRDCNFESQLRDIETKLLTVQQESTQEESRNSESPFVQQPAPLEKPHSDSSVYIDTEPYINPITGQWIFPETADEPGPSKPRFTAKRPASIDDKKSQKCPQDHTLHHESAARSPEPVPKAPIPEISASESHTSAENGQSRLPTLKTMGSPRTFNESTIPPVRHHAPSPVMAEAGPISTFGWGAFSTFRRISTMIPFTNRTKSQAARLQMNGLAVPIPSANARAADHGRIDRAIIAAVKEPHHTLSTRNAVPHTSSTTESTRLPEIWDSPEISTEDLRQRELPALLDQSANKPHGGQKEILDQRADEARQNGSAHALAQRDRLKIDGFQSIGKKIEAPDTNARGLGPRNPSQDEASNANAKRSVPQPGTGSIEALHKDIPSNAKSPEHTQDLAARTIRSEHSRSRIKDAPSEDANVSSSVAAILRYQGDTSSSHGPGEGTLHDSEALLQALGRQEEFDEDLASLNLARQLAGVTPQDYSSLTQLQYENDYVVRQLEASNLDMKRHFATDRSVAQGFAADAPQDVERLMRSEADLREEEARQAQAIADAADLVASSRLQEEAKLARQMAEAADREGLSRLQEEARRAQEIVEQADRADTQAQLDVVRRMESQWNASAANNLAAQQELARTISEREDQLDWERQKQDLQRMQDEWNSQEQSWDADSPVMTPARPAWQGFSQDPPRYDNSSVEWSAPASEWSVSVSEWSSPASSQRSGQQHSPQQNPPQKSVNLSSSRDAEDLAQVIAERRQRQAQWAAEAQNNAQAAEAEKRGVQRKQRERAETARREEDEARAAAERERRGRQADCTSCGDTADKLAMALTPCNHYYDRECITGE